MSRPKVALPRPRSGWPPAGRRAGATLAAAALWLLAGAQLPGCASGEAPVEPVCGNGLLEGSEQCDDGNPDPGDGCSDACAPEAGFECSTDVPSVCAPICGDGQVVGDESCDGSELEGKTCESLNLGAGVLACDEQCQLDPSGCRAYSCGDGAVDVGEECDGADLAGQTCQDHGYDGGTLACRQDCTVDDSGCTLASCGNGIVEGIEECDDANLDPLDGCAGNCTVEAGWACDGQPSVCTPLCGNDAVDPGEQCDGANLAGQSCQSLGQGYTGGTLACGADCQYDTSGCDLPTCGNGALDSGEQCDGVLLDGETCEGLGFIGGTLLCTASCGYDVSGCIPVVCGDGVISAGEACDDGNQQSGDGCNVLCNVEGGWGCSGEPSQCTPLCGNGALDSGEPCDGALLGGSDCFAQGFDAGTLACDTDCTYDTSGCRMASCGDGHADPGEDCDGSDLGGATCQSLGYVSGMLQCTANCGYDPGACVAPTCGDGIISPSAGEQCDDNNTASGDGCNAACQVEVGWLCSGEPSTCEPSCGNSTWDPGEDCDGGDLNGGTCTSEGFAGGTLACLGDCTYDTSGCQAAICGNGNIETGEECDGGNLGGQDCTDFGFAGGTLGCSGCSFDTSACVNCLPQGCTTDNTPHGEECPSAKIIGRTEALTGYHHDGDTTGDGNDDDLPSGEGAVCYDAKYDNFFRIYLLANERLDVELDPIDWDFDAMLKLYTGTDCEGGSNGYADLVSCYNAASDGGVEDFTYFASADGWVTIVVDGRYAFSSDYDYGDYDLDVTLTCNHANCCCP